MRKIETKVIIGLAMIMTMGVSLIGCNGTKNLEQSIIIAEDVKKDTVESILKVIDKKEYIVEGKSDFINEDIFIRDDGNLYINSLLKENSNNEVTDIENGKDIILKSVHVTESGNVNQVDDIANETFIIEKINLEGDKAIKEEVERGKIFKERLIISSEGVYNVENISDNELRLYNPLTQKEYLVDYFKSKSSKFFEKRANVYHELIEDKLVSHEFLDGNNIVDKIQWLNIKDYTTGTIKNSFNINIISLDGDMNNKAYYFANNDKDNYLYPDRIGIINFNKGIMEKPVEIELAYNEKVWYTLNLGNDLMLMVIAEGIDPIGKDIKLRILDLNNKTTKDIATIKSFNNRITISPDKKKLIYEQLNDRKVQIVVASLNNGEIEGKVVVHEYDEREEPINSIVVGKDSSEIILTERAWSNEDVNMNIKSIIKVKLNK